MEHRSFIVTRSSVHQMKLSVSAIFVLRCMVYRLLINPMRQFTISFISCLIPGIILLCDDHSFISRKTNGKLSKHRLTCLQAIKLSTRKEWRRIELDKIVSVCSITYAVRLFFRFTVFFSDLLFVYTGIRFHPRLGRFFSLSGLYNARGYIITNRFVLNR